jgi:hypothetical protein
MQENLLFSNFRGMIYFFRSDPVESQKKSGQRACKTAIMQELWKGVSFKKRKNAKERQYIHKPWKNERFVNQSK